MRQLTRADKAVFVLSTLGLCVYAGTKHPSDTGGDERGKLRRLAVGTAIIIR